MVKSKVSELPTCLGPISYAYDGSKKRTAPIYIDRSKLAELLGVSGGVVQLIWTWEGKIGFRCEVDEEEQE